MSSGKSNGNPQARPLRNQQGPGRNTASPLTPRLAANAGSVKREPSPRRPFVKAASTSRGPSPDKRSETPLRNVATDNVTPRSLVRGKTKASSTVSTPSSTPGSARARTAFVSPRIAAQHTPTDREGAKSNARANTLQSREGSTLSPLAQDPIVSLSHSMDDVTIKNPGSMFFHADDARTHERPPPTTAPPIKKAAGFFYANGHRDEQPPARIMRSASPVMSMFAEKRPLSAVGTRAGKSEVGTGTRQPITSPTLSAISSARSPFVTSPGALSPPLLSASPPKTDYLNTPSASLNHFKMRPGRTHFEPATPLSPLVGGLGVSMEGVLQTPSVQSPRSHTKSSSVSVAPADSPSSTRKRSATWAEVKFDSSPLAFNLDLPRGGDRAKLPSPTLPRINTASSLTSPIISDPLQSPSRDLVDYAADARRERKVLDLEISNSSLLAINRTLEREVKKHKAELKRYRRLSRAGRFSVAPSGLADENFDSALPHVDGGLVGRPSSPFQEDVSDMELSNVDSSDEDEDEPLDASASKEDRQRAKDEAQLRNDLRKHRDLLLDTARMNRSLQRCLTWTEDLIKDGKKALDHHVASSEVKLGGRVLEADDIDDETEGNIEDNGGKEEAEAVLDDADREAIEDDADDLSGIEAFLGMGQWQGNQQSGRMSIGSEGTNRDSGVEMDKATRQQSPPSLTKVC
ncbi:hypothetical protein CAC42_6738 [Sphaceloma murrayae]|uniref:Uncharacterized protein n=1 Tax=Sphaceloma murrayae TaxID=2082308 RepID=A0A2K1QGE1_9PEZI|nr:hypothetical protein CAC42_6738 [Sphaceloma murrayae]